MVWSPSQRTRLAIEKEKLEHYFRLGVTWIDPQHETKVEVFLKSNSDKEYKLRIYIPVDFPNSCPVLVVVSPPKLLLKNGLRLPQMDDSFHTLEDTHGFHRICHFYPPDWTGDITLYQIFMKGRLWIEAYEAHLETGKDMDVFLGEQKFTVSGEAPLDESDIDSDISGLDSAYDGDDSDGSLEYLSHVSLGGQVQQSRPVNNMTSPSTHLSDQTLPTAVQVLQSFPQLPTFRRPLLRDEASAIDLPDDQRRPLIENKDNPPSQLSQLPFSPVENQSPQRRFSNEISRDFTHPSPNDNNDKAAANNDNAPANNDTPANDHVPANDNAPSRPYRPAGAIDVFLPFHEEMIRRNSSSGSHARPRVLPPPTKPKPKRPR